MLGKRPNEYISEPVWAINNRYYDGEPTWHEVRLEYDDGSEFYNLGILELKGEEKIFPVDGQHRVEGIKKVTSNSDKFDDEKIPVIFIGHKTDDAGMQRSRRLFSTLNRYAKPVSMRDIIALDEDDIIAICSRELIDTHPLFAKDRILDSKTKAIPESNETAFTTIITFYECNREILWILLKDFEISNSDGKKIRGKAKITEFIRKRPSDDTIHKFIELCTDFWDNLIDCFDDVYEYASHNPDAKPYRNRTGGNLLFRPVALLPFIRAAVKVYIHQQKSFGEIFDIFISIPPIIFKYREKLFLRFGGLFDKLNTDWAVFSETQQAVELLQQFSGLFLR